MGCIIVTDAIHYYSNNYYQNSRLTMAPDHRTGNVPDRA